MADRCVMCGEPFPPGTFASRKYCYECHLIRIQQRKAEQRERDRVRKEQEKLKPKPAYIQSGAVNKTDEAYCKGCFYHNTHSDAYLCNYILRTGRKRGCPAGVGCTERREAGE